MPRLFTLCSSCSISTFTSAFTSACFCFYLSFCLHSVFSLRSPETWNILMKRLSI